MKILNLIPLQTGIGIVDFATSTPFLRSFIGKALARLAYYNVLKVNDYSFPVEVQRDKVAMIIAIIYSVERGLAHGLINPTVRHKLAEIFFGKIMLKPEEQRRQFKAQFGTDPPGFITISPTARCNLKCHGCYAASDAAQKTFLPYSVFDRILREKVDLWGSHFTVISGGEPFLYRDEGRTLLDIIAEHPEQYFLIYTNGTMINREVAKRLGELGNATPAISVEGMEKETDSRRGKGTFKRILAAYDNLRQAGVPFGVSVTALRHNAELLFSDEFFDFFFERQGALYEWVFQYMPIGRGFDLHMMVTPEQRLDMYTRTWDLIRNRHLFIADFWNCGTVSDGCIAAGGGKGGGYYYIDWNGSIAPCVFNPFHTHNIKEVFASGGDLNTLITLPLFREIRKWQTGYFHDRPNDRKGNLIAPCPYRDHHRRMREIIDVVHACPIDENGGLALKDPEYREGMIRYGMEFKRLTAPIWENRYIRPEREKSSSAPDERLPSNLPGD